ncbi:hypothetical protein AVEN_245469-1 [Araneus ventricosus]|uniref:Uncharacterized protein n=1 Tax=Araneus ventricosus TaxID=182803 RepID=A0A4Y2D910_ARAVE|nr:hypothetical protein AVEN_245469-1 [Araneus ventricosus]
MNYTLKTFNTTQLKIKLNWSNFKHNVTTSYTCFLNQEQESHTLPTTQGDDLHYFEIPLEPSASEGICRCRESCRNQLSTRETTRKSPATEDRGRSSGEAHSKHLSCKGTIVSPSVLRGQYSWDL